MADTCAPPNDDIAEGDEHSCASEETRTTPAPAIAPPTRRHSLIALGRLDRACHRTGRRVGEHRAGVLLGDELFASSSGSAVTFDLGAAASDLSTVTFSGRTRARVSVRASSANPDPTFKGARAPDRYPRGRLRRVRVLAYHRRQRHGLGRRARERANRIAQAQRERASSSSCEVCRRATHNGCIAIALDRDAKTMAGGAGPQRGQRSSRRTKSPAQRASYQGGVFEAVGDYVQRRWPRKTTGGSTCPLKPRSSGRWPTAP